MKKKTWFLLLIALGLLALFVSKSIISDNEPEEPKDKDNITRERNAQSSNKKEKSETKQVTKRSRNVYKPVTPFVSRSGAAILEIDHGLPEQRINTKEMRYGVDYGLKAAITLHVVDSTGTPVSDATVRGAFWNPHIKDREFNVKTDMYGDVSLENKCTGDLNFSVTKDGYHESGFRYWFFKNGFDCAKDGRWLPWNPTVEVILKRKINPVAMYVRPNREGLTPLVPPVKNKYIGFDLEKGDWVNPYGKGICSDFNLKYEYEAGMVPLLHYRGAVFFSFTNKHDGAYVMNKDVFSLFSSLYQAETNALYQQEFAFVYDRLSGDTTENTKFSESEYLVIRTRSKTDENGNLISAHYSKMYGPISAGGGGVYMGFYFNPNKNDSNLEADTTQNLLNPNDLGFTP